MNVEIINIGTELLLGSTLNTHQQWLSRRLGEHGYTVVRQVTIPDTGGAICDTVKSALASADLVITTGGLGPTSDDITRELIAAMLHRPLRREPQVESRIREFYSQRNRAMPARVLVQALVPEGAVVVENSKGTAPGLAIDLVLNPFRESGERSLLVMLPGPPRELRPMFNEQILPLLSRSFPAREGTACAVLRTTGIPESVVESKITDPLARLMGQGLELGYCARPGEVDVRLSKRGKDCERIVDESMQIVRCELGGNIYTEVDEELETAIVRLLTEKKLTLACAESCSGGLIAHRLTDVPGASIVFLAGLITYSNESKAGLLSVPVELLQTFGAVSEPVCAAMAEGVRRVTGADIGLATTGIAGPAGGSPEKPVGTVFIGIADESGATVRKQMNRWERAMFKQVTSQQALDRVRRRVLGLSEV